MRGLGQKPATLSRVQISEAVPAVMHEGVLVDSGTTTLEVALAIRRRKLGRVTVVTNSLAINGLDPEVGPSTSNILEAEWNPAMIQSA